MWRNTALRAEFMPGVDGRVSVALLAFLLHWAWWTFGLFGGICGLFWLMDRRGYTLRTFFLRGRRMMTGNMKTKWPEYEYCRRKVPGDIPVV